MFMFTCGLHYQVTPYGVTAPGWGPRPSGVPVERAEGGSKGETIQIPPKGGDLRHMVIFWLYDSQEVPVPQP